MTIPIHTFYHKNENLWARLHINLF